MPITRMSAKSDRAYRPPVFRDAAAAVVVVVVSIEEASVAFEDERIIGAWSAVAVAVAGCSDGCGAGVKGTDTGTGVLVCCGDDWAKGSLLTTPSLIVVA